VVREVYNLDEVAEQIDLPLAFYQLSPTYVTGRSSYIALGSCHSITDCCDIFELKKSKIYKSLCFFNFFNISDNKIVVTGSNPGGDTFSRRNNLK